MNHLRLGLGALVGALLFWEIYFLITLFYLLGSLPEASLLVSFFRVKTELLFFWQPLFSRFFTDPLFLFLIFAGFSWYLKNGEEGDLSLKNWLPEIALAMIWALGLNIALGARLTFWFGIATIVSYGFWREWENQRRAPCFASCWGILTNYLVHKIHWVVGAALGLGILNGFLISAWLLLWLAVLPLFIILLVTLFAVVVNLREWN